MIRRILLASLLARSATAFTAPASSTVASQRGGSQLRFSSPLDDQNFESTFDPLHLADNDADESSQSTATSAIAIATAALLSTPLSASAAGPDWGIFEGRTGSLLHPIAMASMAAFSISTALLGFQWRRQRTIGDEISGLKKSLPDLKGASTVREALAAAEGAEEVDASYVAKLKGAMGTANEIEELTKERKELSSSGPRDKHFNQGSLLLFIGTAFAIEVRLSGVLFYFGFGSCTILVMSRFFAEDNYLLFNSFNILTHSFPFCLPVSFIFLDQGAFRAGCPTVREAVRLNNQTRL